MGRGIARSARAVYQMSADAECTLPGGALLAQIRAELRRHSTAATSLDERERIAAEWSTAQAMRYRDLIGQRDAETRRGLLVRAILSCAPLAALSGAWLQWLTAPGNADDPIALRTLTLFADDVGIGRPHFSRGDAFLALMGYFGLSEYARPAARLALDQRITDSAFMLPALLLAMSRRPADFRSEILGADLCLRTVGLLPALTMVRAEVPAADWNAIDAGAARRDGHPAAHTECRRLLRALLDGDADQLDRVALGFDWAMETLRRGNEDIYAELDAARDPAYEMAELIRRRAGEGSVYHHRFQLSGRPLASWLADSRTDPGPFLAALAQSRLVTPGHSDRSPLVNGLVLDRGPMFRVFAGDDLAVIRRWIDALPARGDAIQAANRPRQASELSLTAFEADPPDPGHPPRSPREAYHRLQRRTVTPALRRFALQYVQRRLARSRHRIGSTSMPLPSQWPVEGLRPWLTAQHEQHAREFEETADVPLPSRDELIDTTVQLAPLALIDGAWLHGFTDYEQASTSIGHALFDTYWDELGNGDPALNHPLIYRQVLAEMDVQLPPTGSREFAFWPGFRDSSFELPVYWLCIGRFPRTFLPEVLGLNLAMELSGVGGSYRRARIVLRHHGFSTRFVDIHNTIDNVATGHSAWAADATDTYLSTLPSSSEAGARAAAWERVRTGYRSLTLPPRNRVARRTDRLFRRRATTKDRTDA